jgi:bis(5'-nucleosyl)-tetraphosphatase (symmetrical)
VHGGLDPRWTDLRAVAAAADAAPHDDDWLTSAIVNFATRVRCCTASGERSKFDRDPAQCPPPFRPWDQFYRGSALVVHGHWAWRGHYRNPPGGPRTMGLDSGCVYGGELTAWCQEEDRVVQVKAARAY